MAGRGNDCVDSGGTVLGWDCSSRLRVHDSNGASRELFWSLPGFLHHIRILLWIQAGQQNKIQKGGRDGRHEWPKRCRGTC